MVFCEPNHVPKIQWNHPKLTPQMQAEYGKFAIFEQKNSKSEMVKDKSYSC